MVLPLRVDVVEFMGRRALIHSWSVGKVLAVVIAFGIWAQLAWCSVSMIEAWFHRLCLLAKKSIDQLNWAVAVYGVPVALRGNFLLLLVA